MEKAIRVINELKRRRLIRDYVIGGGIAVLYYVEPILTYDLDIFFIPKKERDEKIVMFPIQHFLRARGYNLKNGHVNIDGIPVQFIPAYNELIKEAFEHSIETKYKKVKTKIFQPEYLIAIMAQVFRPENKERIITMLDETEIDKNQLMTILKKHHLKEKFDRFIKLYYGE